MNLFTGEAADEFFGGAVPEAVRQLMHQAAQAPRGEVGALLWTAQALAPQCLAVYYALYKHHAGRRELEQAEGAARRGLQEAAQLAGLAADWRRVTPAELPAGLDFGANGPARLVSHVEGSFIACAAGGRPMRELRRDRRVAAGSHHDVIASMLSVSAVQPDQPQAWKRCGCDRR
jgi:hypothetical protein